mgnify:CR=1 FL=1
MPTWIVVGAGTGGTSAITLARPGLRDVIGPLVDHGDFLELKERHAANVVTALARIGGKAYAIKVHGTTVATNPRREVATASRNPARRCCGRGMDGFPVRTWSG